MNLQGKVAIVTGASAGIGRAYALALADAGATVIALARRLAPHPDEAQGNSLSTTVKMSESLTGRIYAQECDISVEAEIVRAIEQTATNFGRIDVLVNNAAFMSRLDAFQISGDVWDRFMITNVRGPYVTIRQVAPYMKRQRSGSIINITAGAGMLSPKSNYEGMLPYAVSKAALNRLSYFMADELKPYGIAVNCLSPGVVLSESALKDNPQVAVTGTHKPATPEALGPALLYLAQQTAETLTGQILHTDQYLQSWP